MKSINLRCMVAAVSGALLMGFGANAMADTTDDIVNALMAKGVLTKEEGALLMRGRSGEKEAAAKKKETGIAASYKDGILFESGDKKNSIQVNGRLHFDSRTYDYSSNNNINGAASATGADTFDIRRARIGAKFKFLEYYSGEIVFNGVGGTPVVDVAYGDIAWWKMAKIRVGQFKMPFSLEQLTSSNNIDFIERSFVDAYIPAKEIGAMVFGEPFKGTTYGLAFSNGNPAPAGTGTETDNRVDNKDVIGRVTANFAEMMDNKDMVLHVGLAYSTGDVPKGNATSLGGNRSTESRGASFFTAPTLGTADATDKAIDRTRLGLEGVVANGPFKAQAQWVNAGYDYSTMTANLSPDIKTWYAEALWTISGESHAERYKAGAFGALKPKNNFDPDKFTGGAWEVGARYSGFDASDFTAALGASGYAKAKAYTAGIKFIANPHLRFMLDYVKTNFEDRIGNSLVTVNGQNETNEKALLFRTQVAF